MRATRRKPDQILADAEKEIEFLNRGKLLDEIAEEMGLTYTQVNRDLNKHYPDRAFFDILKQNGRNRKRVTIRDIRHAEELKKILPLKTVAYITGFSWHRLSSLGPNKTMMQNTRLLAQVGEWLLASYLKEVKPSPEWKVLCCINGTPYAPDFHNNEEWWDSKAYNPNPSSFLAHYEGQLQNYMNVIPKGSVLYWYGFSDKVRKLGEERGISLISGKDLLNSDISTNLRNKIERYLDGDFINLAKEWYGIL
uniref:Uncharacterized protein n=1 Tax=viral metagenome TaxID=1070528 RepID=A0A6M3LVY8_9ZZZZ